MKETDRDKKSVEGIKTEKDIFKFFNLKYIKPKNRKDETSIIEKIAKNKNTK